MGMVAFVEPFPRLMNQGQVIYGGASMSKTKGNIVEPMPLVERWGADTMRLTMLFAGPFEDDIDWKLIAPDPIGAGRERLARPRVRRGRRRARARSRRSRRSCALTHRTIEGVTEDLERFRFNVAISKLQVLTNEIRSALDAGGGGRRRRRAGPDAGAVGPVHRRGAVARGARDHESVHIAAWPAFDPALAQEHGHAGRAGGRQGPRPDRGRGRRRRGGGAGSSRSPRRRPAGDRRAGDRSVIVRAPRLVNFVTR